MKLSDTSLIYFVHITTPQTTPCPPPALVLVREADLLPLVLLAPTFSCTRRTDMSWVSILGSPILAGRTVCVVAAGVAWVDVEENGKS